MIRQFPSITDQERQTTFEITNRSDLVRTRLAADQSLLAQDILKAENDLKSDLSLSVRAGLSGFDESSWGDAMEDISGDNYHTEIAVSYTFPVINTGAESRLAISRYRMEQLNLQMAFRENETRKMVYELFDDMASVKSQLELNRQSVALSKENLDNEIERLKAEKTTVLNVLDYQRALIAAESAMLSTQLDYALLIGTFHLYRQEMKRLAKGSAPLH